MAEQKEQESFAQKTFKNTIAGTMGGMNVCFVGHPFDTLKVRLQTQPIDKPIYTGVKDCFIKTIKWEGVSGLYKGVASPLAGQMFFRATFFATFFQVSELLAESPGQRLSRLNVFLAGSLTGVVGTLLESPIDLFKTKMQIQIIRAKSGHAVQYKGVFHAGYVIAKNYGIRGIFQGFGPSLVRNVPSYGYYFGFFELVKELLTPEGGDVNKLPIWKLCIAGGCGGFSYWFLNYPPDVFKSAMQSDELDPSKRKYKNMIDCAKKLYFNEGGIKRYFRGFTPCLMRSIPANAVMLTTVDMVRRILDPYFA